MKFDEFQETFREALEKAVRESGDALTVKPCSIAKLNYGEREAYTLVPKGTASSTGTLFYLEDCYLQHLQGYSIEEILSRGLEKERDFMDAKREFLTRPDTFAWEKIKDKVFVITYGYEKNQKLLDQFPHIRRKDFAATYHILLEQGEDSYSHIAITNSIAVKLGIGVAELHETAVQNSMRWMPDTLESISDVFQTLQPDENQRAEELEGFLESPPFPLDVLTNTKRNLGASVIFYPGVLERIGEKYPKGYYLLPSSIHELMVIPKMQGSSWRTCEEIVREVNQTTVSPSDFLSDHVHAYDPSRKRLLMGAEIDLLERMEPSRPKPALEGRKR